MHFEIKHQFNADAKKVASVMVHADLPARLNSLMTTIVAAETLSRTETKEKLTRKVRYTPKPLIERVGPKKVEPRWMEWVEESEFDYKTLTGRFKNVPRIADIAAHLENSGTVIFRDLGPGRCERVIEGELKVKLPLLMRPLAAVAEAIIHKQAKVILDDEAKAISSVLEKGGL